MYKSFISVLLFISIPLYAQIERGSLSIQPHPDEVNVLFQQGKLNLTELRQITNFLTDRDLKTHNGIPLSKRKKAFIRHIKHLSEYLETVYQKDNYLDTIQIYEQLYELVLFKNSLIEKSVLAYQVKPNFFAKLKLFIDTKRSRFIFKYPINGGDFPKDISNPVDSPYWHSFNGSKKRHKCFSKLAKLKKIKARKKMYVLFDKLSYSGSAPKIRTLDLDLDNEWSLKWGDEVHTDVVGSRIFAALGYDVDHPYYYGKDQLTLILDDTKSIHSAKALCDSILLIYDIDLKPFLSKTGVVDSDMILENERLAPYLGNQFITFIKCGIEGRPDRVKRIGPFLADDFGNANRRSLRGALLAHAFIGNWDTAERNTLLTTIHDGNYNYRMSAVFSDLGTSFGVKINMFPADFKVGLVNEFPWDLVKIKGKKIILNYQANSILEPYRSANYFDLKWMAMQIHDLDEGTLRKIINKSGWPEPIAELYFHKLASRRASILAFFNIGDKHPIKFDRLLTIKEDGVVVVENGKLTIDYQRKNNPESFLSNKGRFRNYGN